MGRGEEGVVKNTEFALVHYADAVFGDGVGTLIGGALQHCWTLLAARLVLQSKRNDSEVTAVKQNLTLGKLKTGE